MYAKNCKYGYLPHLKRPLLGGVIILSLSFSSLYAVPPPAKSVTTTTTKTDANGSGIHAKSNSSAIGIAGTNNVTVINRTTIINNNYAHPKVVAKKPVIAKAKPIPKTPAKTIPKKIVPVVKKAPTTAATPKKGDCLATHSSDYCKTTGKLLK